MDSCLPEGIITLPSFEEDGKVTPIVPLKMQNQLLEESFSPIGYIEKQFHYNGPSILDEIGVSMNFEDCL